MRPLLNVPAFECIITGTIISEPSYGRIDALDVLREIERGLEYASKADVRSAAFKL